MVDHPTYYYFDLDGRGTDFFRARFTTRGGRVLRFAMQYETVIDGRIYPVVRYDTAHGRPHRDLLDWDGRVIAKDWLDLSRAEALTWAQDDIQRNWPGYKTTFLEMRP